MQQRVGVIGLGGIGNRHADVYAADPGAELAAVCDVDHDRADAAATRLGVPGFYSVSDMLAGTELTMVSVATAGEEYGSDHYAPTMQAFEAGLHVLGEKPICNEIAPAEAMVALAAQQGLCYGIDLNHRFTPAAQLAKRWVDEGRIGPQLFMNISMWIMNPRESSPWFQIKALHPHTVDIMRYFCGDIEAVQCFAMKAPGRTIWSTAQFNMRFSSGALGHLSGSYDIERGHPMERCEVAGVNGRFVIEDMFREATLYPAGNPEKTVYTNPVFGGMRDFSDTFVNRLGRFVEQLNEGASPDQIDGSGADGLAAQKVLAAAIESVETGTVVTLS
ncbi:MAG: Gfo/Idh/MocA family oxidoreductase [Verrucomicrobia bacterium]|jgi:predicted dehydrogenase|nr:Gfo/Idh/MocA family oxidoreductase [Verrucomicrobiota bacterium]MBT7067916.1 Gfo/Idh/MocA family oxidoreductase [Verrucomicrobiota bacterium]MBT7702265.1 Gfo/Idh/MocA family oxidoreductase [Verrucomicrobiota bacterium]